MFKFYEVGGKVRDELLNLTSKDVDYTVVPSDELLNSGLDILSIFKKLEEYLTIEGFTIFLSTPECYTIRAMFPNNHKYSGVADFVLARKEIGYIPNTRTPILIPGTLYDDLERRDFTLNALAKDEDGNIIDYFNGMSHLSEGILITPINCEITFNDDPLRILRAIRFSITKEFTIHQTLVDCMKSYDYFTKMHVVSSERIREELFKCFKHDTLKTIYELSKYPNLLEYCFMCTDLWLNPTNKK